MRLRKRVEQLEMQLKILPAAVKQDLQSLENIYHVLIRRQNRILKEQSRIAEIVKDLQRVAE